MIRRVHLLFICMICLVLPVFGGGEAIHSIKGRVIKPDGTPLAYANVLLLARSGAQPVFIATADTNGVFYVIGPADDYIFEISFLGFEKYQDSLCLNYNIDLSSIVLHPNVTSLEQVVVTHQPVRRNANGYTMYVSGNKAFKGMDAKELLNMAPGIISDDRTLSIYGQQVSKVYINERELMLTGLELIEYLKTISSEALQKIELVISGGVEEDSQAMGGRVLKLSTRSIENGGSLSVGSSATLTNGQYGFVIPRINLDLREGKFSSYLRTNFSWSEFKNEFVLRTKFHDSARERKMTSEETGKMPNSFGVTWGGGYDFSSRDILSLEISYYRQRSEDQSRSLTQEYDSGTLTDYIKGDEQGERMRKYVNLSVNYIRLLKNEGKLLFKADTRLSDTWDNAVQNFYYPLSEMQVQTRNCGDYPRNIYTLSGEFSKKWAKIFEFKTGIKYTHFRSNNQMFAQQLEGDTWITRPDYTDNYHYKEHIYAAYAKGSLEWRKLHLLAGVRMEISSLHPHSYLHTERNKQRTLCDFLPELAIGYTINEEKGDLLSLHFVRSMARPSFTDLNPYMRSYGPSTVFIGNPDLDPSRKTFVELNYTLRNKYVFLFSFEHEEGEVLPVIFSDLATGILYHQPQNFGCSRQATLYFTSPIKVTDWWSMDFGGGYTYQDIITANQRWHNHLFVIEGGVTLNLPDKFNLVLSGSWYNHLIQGNSKIWKPFDFYIRINKLLCKDKLVIAASIGDLFNSEAHARRTFYGNNFTQWSQKRGQFQCYSLSLNYRFQWGSKPQLRHVESGNREEKERD